MSTVHRGKNAFGASQSAEFFGRQDDAAIGGDVTEEHHSSTRGDCVVEQVENLFRILHWLGKRDLLNDDTVSLSFQLPRAFPSWVLLVGHQDLVARFHVDTISYVAVGFRGITKERDLIPLATDKLGQRVTKLVPRCIAPDRVVLGIVLV